MNITVQGYGHYKECINNQDYYLQKENLKMVLDGCSGSDLSEVGTRLFVQLFSTLPNATKLECFEENVKKVFDFIIDTFSTCYEDGKKLEKFISDNLLFTIIACFETEENFVVKMFGDGYIVTVNNYDRISYQRYYYGGYPPYFAYKYCKNLYHEYNSYNFKTYEFSKKDYKKVGIATDGISPIAKRKINVDRHIILGYDFKQMVLSNKTLFFDDVTILI